MKKNTYSKGQVEGIILAAGYSSRADAFKPELDLEGKSVIEYCISGMYDVCSRVIVVCGYMREKLFPILRRYEKVEAVYNRNYDAGMFTSVKEGLKYVRGRRIFIVPADYPLINRITYETMLDMEESVIIPVFKGQRGHPLLMRGNIAKEALKEPDSSNLRQFTDKKGYCTIEVNDAGILEDLDTQEDYRRIIEKIKAR